ncbi:MAG: Ig-like domain-containing protein [Saprospiraceae bacterium]
MNTIYTFKQYLVLVFLFGLFTTKSIAQNNAPIANIDYYMTYVNTPVSGDVSLNDFDIDQDTLVYNTNPITNVGGTVVINSNGTFTYTPTPNFIGVNYFHYQVCDTVNPPLCTGKYIYMTVIDSSDFIQHVGHTNLANCDYFNDGTITIHTNSLANPANLNYSIDGGNSWQNNPIFNHLDTGDYYIQVKDVVTNLVDTFVSNPLTITAPTPLVTPTIQNIVQPTSCNSYDGSFVINSNSSDPVQFSLDDGTTWLNWNSTYNGNKIYMANNLSNGHYKIKVRRSYIHLCEVIAPDVILSSSPTYPMITNISSTNPTSDVVSDGSITIITSGGQAPLAYSIDGGLAWQNTNFFTNLSHGYYNPVVRNADSSCAAQYYSQIHLTAPLLIDTIVDYSNCNTTSLSVVAIHGTGNYQYSIDSGATWQSFYTFTNLQTGNYNLFINDGIDTIAYINNPVVITSPIVPVLNSINSVNPTSCSSADGTITINTTGANLEYSITDGLSWQTSNTFTGLNNGYYNIVVRGINTLCSVTNLTDTVILTAPNSVIIDTINITHPINCNVSDGAITITAINGLGTYEYSIDNGTNWQSSNSFVGLTGGTYAIGIRNSDSTCEMLGQMITLTSPNAPTIIDVLYTHPLSCSVPTGSIEIQATGSLILEYSIDDGTTWQSYHIFTSLVEGTYSPRVRNISGTCEVVHPDIPLVTSLNNNSATVTNVVVTKPTNGSSNDGAVTVYATGSGTLKYTLVGQSNYLFQSSNYFTNLACGTYDLYVQNGNCSIFHSQVEVVCDFEISEVYINHNCDTASGMISIIALQGTGNYQYSIDSGATWQSTLNYYNLTAGTYHIFATDGVDTIGYPNNPVTIIPALGYSIYSIATADASTCGVYDGTITIAATGTNLVYSITGGINWQSSNTFTGLGGGAYDVAIRNANGTCQSVYAHNPVYVSSAGVLWSVSGTNISDCGMTNGIISINYTGSLGSPLEFSIDGGITWSANSLFTGLAAGTYSARVRNTATNCISFYHSTIVLTAPTSLSITNVVSTNPTNCGVTDGTITITTINGSGSYEYSIDGGNSWQPSNTFTSLQAGTYNVAIRNTDGTCETPYSNNPVIINNPPVNAGNDTSICINSNVITLNGTPSGGTWSGLGIVDSANGIFNGITAGGVGTYDLAYTFTGGNSCSNSDTVTITVMDLADFNTVTYQYNNDSLIVNLINNNGLEYSIDSGLTWQSSNTFFPVSSGDYDIAARYLNSNCIAYDNLSLNPVIAINDTFYNNPFNAQGNVLFNDIENGVTANLITQPVNGTISNFDALGNFTYEPNTGFLNIDSFTYSICDTIFSNLCDTATVVIQISDTLILQSVSHTNTTDCTNPNGEITIVALTNSPTLQYSIDGGTNWIVNNTFTNLIPGYYNIMVNNSIDTIAYTANPIEILLPISATISTITKTNPTDCSVNDGTITLTTINGTGQELYTIDGGTTWQLSNIFTGLAAGTYDRINIGVNNPNNNCTWFTSGNPIVLTTPSPPTINNVIITNPTNCTTTNGEIQITATSTNTLEYSIDNGLTWNTNNHFTGLSCGNYDIWVQNNDTTCAVSYGQIALQTQLTIDTVLTLFMDCGQNNGEIEIIAQNGSGNYSYSIDSGLTWQSSAIFTNLSVGNYPVFVHDGIDTIPYTVINPIMIMPGNLPYFNTIYDGDSLVINPIYTGNWEYSLDCGTTWQMSNSFYPITDTINCIGVRATDGSCPVFEQDTLNNSLPIAVLDSFPVQQPILQIVNVLNNDFDADNNAIYTLPAVYYFGNDSVTIDSFGNVTIPTNDFDLGIHTINYQVCETYLPTSCSQGTAILTVIPAPTYLYDTIAIGSHYTICPTFELTTDVEYVVESCMTTSTLVLDSLVNNCFHYYADNYGVYTACLVGCDSIGMCDTTYLNITVQDGVWPGDTDDDTYVNNFDLLNIGIAYGTSGTPRDSVTNVWNGYITPLWNVATAGTNIDYRHADCNGDGIVNSIDTVAILQNYNLNYQKNGGGNNGTPLQIVIDSNFIVPSFNLPIQLGNMTTPAGDIYGGAFSVLYDTSLIKKNSVYITFDNSWIGTNNLDMISINKNFGNEQQIDAAFTRIDGINATGFGQIGTLNFTIKDDIFQRGFNVDSVIFNFEIINTKFIDRLENDIPIATETTSWVIVNTQHAPIIGKNITIFPNPTKEYVHIQSPNLLIEYITITDVVGRTVLQQKPFNNQDIQLNLSDLKTGVYYLQLETTKGKVVRKLVIL